MAELNSISINELNKKIAELEAELKSLRKFGLVWEKESIKEEVVLKCENNIPILDQDENKTVKFGKQNNVLIEGDNFHALTTLNMVLRNSVDFIYIDPPYNTGARDWKYNNDYVDSDDGYRHSKWLNMMDKRLKLSKELLTDDGVICVTIDDYEMPNLWLLMDSIFGEKNRLGVVTIRNNPKGRMTKTRISQVHEYALYYGKSDKSIIPPIEMKPEEKSHNYVKDENGNYYLKMNLRKQGVDSEAIKPDGTMRERYFPIYYDPKSGKVSTKEKLEIEILPIDANGFKRIWRRDQDGVQKLFDEGELFCQKLKNEYQVYFRFRGGLDGQQPKSIWSEPFFSASEYGTNVLANVLGAREKFPYPKSLEAVKYSIKSGCNKKDALILDFFAGSGTTGHAVLDLNKEDGGNRRFILCTNNENNICEEVTYPRLKTVMTGKKPNNDVYSSASPANLFYFKTSFINDNRNSDQARYSLAERLDSLLCIKENIMELVDKNDFYSHYISSNSNEHLFIYSDYYNEEKFNHFKNQVEQCEGKRIVYVYSNDNSIDDAWFDDSEISVKPIPMKMYEIFKEISEEIKRG